MPSPYFHFKHFSIRQEFSAMKVGTDGVLLGAWAEISDSDSRNLKLLDVGTGTGLIALMLGQKISMNFPRISYSIDAVDMDESSCREARENIIASQFDENIKVIVSTIQNFSRAQQPGIYNYIVSNPPFFTDSLKPEHSGRNLARHADFSMLSGDTLTDMVTKLLNPDGRFFLILPIVEGEKFIVSAQRKNLFCSRLTRVFSKPGKKCIRLLMEFSKENKVRRETVLHIETGLKDGDYTEEYRKLTRDFYLAF